MSEPAAAVVIPAAEQPPATPARELTFGERLEAKAKELGADLADDDAAADAPTEAPAAPDKKAKAPAAAPVAATDPREAKRAQLKALVEELGLNLVDGEISTTERIAARNAKQKNEAWVKQKEAELAKKDAEYGEKLSRSQAVMDAYERGDPDGFAKALGAKDFNEFQTSFIKRLADPNYNELRRLQQKVEEKEAAEKKAAEEATKRAQGAEYQKARAAYMQNLTATCSKSANPLVAAMADDPLFLEAVYKIQEENWDPDAQATITVEQAIKKAMRGAKTDLESELRGLHERLSKGFAAVGATAPAAASKTNGNGKKPAPKTAVVPATSNGGGGAPKSVGEMSPKEWAQYKASKFAQAED